MDVAKNFELESVAQSILDSKGHYDIDGVSLWHGRTVVASGVLEINKKGDQFMETKENPKKPVRKLTIPIHGLACGGGGSLQLEKQIEKVHGVVKVYVNPATREAYVDVIDDFKLDEALSLIKKNGFQYDEPRWN